jgi:PPK2 family polyphosphate:nucleotide phosphotransferase
MSALPIRVAGVRRSAGFGTVPNVFEQLRVKPGSKVSLAKRATDETFGWDKEQAKADLVEELAKLAELQTRLFAEEQRSVLVVLQAMDAAGKDGTIRSIFTGVNPAGVRVTSFGVPAGAEVAHDYLWRVHGATPAKGQIGVFNRSHYEDVLVVRVKKFVPKERWSKRYEHIRGFEQMLSDEGTRIVKIYLHVSPEEQAARLQDRIDDPAERWKFRLGDLDDRKLWPAFMKAYQDAMAETSTKQAPWFVVPADRKWVRNLVIAKLLVATLQEMDPQLPPPDAGIDGLKVV